MRRDNERLEDILTAIAAIERYIQQGRSAFDEQELIQVWVAYHLQMIGEAANSLSADLKTQHPEIPWVQIIGLRNLLVHEYFRVDPQILWDITQTDLQPLKMAIQTIQKELESP
ncbi:MAG: HepT-like ribonuclease domain-containing protein [Leptolyngbyaceae cyanobacterium bins.59]|nr:HepT-like ribonuclease domain-containing protein [Leptolyngbyaceae cyanobacterium bins.59]